MGRIWRVNDRRPLYRGTRLWILREPLSSTFLEKYNNPDTHANSCSHIYSTLPIIHCARTCLLLACHPRKYSRSHFLPVTYTMHVITLPSRMKPTQFTRHFHRKHPCPVYFRCKEHFLLFLFPVRDFHTCNDIHQRDHQVNFQQKRIQKNIICAYNECNSLTCWHKINLDSLTCC